MGALSFEYWFNLTPTFLSQGGFNLLIVVFGILIVAAIVLRLKIKQSDNKLKKKQLALISTWANTVGLVGVIYTWLTYERVYILGARFWLIIIAIWAIIWLLLSIRKIRVDLPEHFQKSKQQQEMQKYMPKKK